MKNHIRNHILTVFLILIALSCSHYSVDKLMSAPEKIEIDGREYILETGLYCDDFPPIGLSGLIYVIALDSLQFSSSLDASHVWVIYDDNVWDSDLIDRTIPDNQTFKMRKAVRDHGPECGPYIRVVVEIVKDDNSGYLLRADSQYVDWIYLNSQR